MIRAIAVGLATLGMLAGFSISIVAHAETSAEYAMMGKKIWPSFICAVAAGILKDEEATKRLFNVGYEGGKKFIEALRDNKVTREDVSSSVAVAVTLRLKGPNSDFMLGSIWDGASGSFYDEMSEKCKLCISDDELKRMWVTNRYREMNCDFIK